MAAFDVEGYRKAATAAGIPESEIENEIRFQTSDPAKTDPFEKDEGGFKLGSAEQISERLGNDWWHLPAGLAAIGAGIYGASQFMGRGDTPPPSGGLGLRIDPTMDVLPVAQQAPIAQPDRLQQAQQIIEANKQLGLSSKPVPPTAPVAAPVAPPEPISTPITAAPIDAPAATPTAGPGSPVTSIINDTVKELIQQTPDPVTGAAPAQPVAPPQDLRTGTGKPAFAGMGPEAALNKKGQPKFKPEYASVADVPSGYAFVPGADKIDTLRQNLGQAPYTEFFTKRDFPLTNESAIEQSKEINRLLGKPTRAELIAAGLPPAVNTPGITQLTNAPKGSGMGTKTARVAGTLGALIAIPDLAKADTGSQRAMAGANLLEAVLPPGFMMSGAGAGSDMPPSMAQAMLLGSPYAQTDFAKKQRQEQEYVRKVGAGRGIAPPSAYMR
jgi:hypothetical protein